MIKLLLATLLIALPAHSYSYDADIDIDVDLPMRSLGQSYSTWVPEPVRIYQETIVPDGPPGYYTRTDRYGNRQHIQPDGVGGWLINDI